MSLSRKQLEALRRQVGGGEGDEEREAVQSSSPGSALAETSRGSSSAIAAADPTQADPARVTEIAAVLGNEILSERAKVLAVLRSQNEVRDLSMQVFEGQINIGRSVGALRPTLSPNEYRRLIDQSDRLYGAHLTRSTVVKLIAVADAVDRPRFPVERLPRAYTLIYEFAAMADSLLARAEAAGLIRPDVTRRAVVEFKRAALSAPAEFGRRSGAQLRQLRKRLNEQRAALARRLAEIDAEVAEIDAKLAEGLARAAE